MPSLPKFKDDFILLAEAGFIAVNQADEDAATKLFKAAEVLNPTNMLPKVGMGYLHLCKLELKQAAKCFEDVLAKDPTNEMAKAFLGLSLALTPTEMMKGEKMLHECATKGKDGQVKKLSDLALDFVERFVKKAPSPADLHKKSK